MSAEDPPPSGITRALPVGVADARATDVAAALCELAERLPAHPGLLPVLDGGVSKGRVFIVTPDVQADSLEVALAEYGPAAFADALPRLQQLADALDLAARSGLVHGALTPADILVSADDTCCVGVGVRPSLWRIGISTPATGPYAAPEAASGDASVTAAADQYALAAIAHEWLFGVRLATRAASDRATLPGVDAAQLRRAFEQATAAEPAERFATCTDLVAALANASTHAAAVDQRVFEFAAPMADLPLRRSAAVTATAEEPGGVPVAQGYRASAVALALLGGVVVGASAMWLYARPSAPAQATGGQEYTDAEVTVAPAIPNETAAADSVRGDAERRTRDVSEPQVATPRGEVPAETALEAGLLIHSTPAGALVSVDGLARGTTPLAVRGLGLGARTVSLSRDGYQPVVRQVMLTPDRPSRALEVELLPAYRQASTAAAVPADGMLIVDSRPAGATVFVDGRAAGITPLTLALPPGPYAVRIERVGYRAVVTRVEVRAGERERVAARLEGGLDEE